MTPELMRYISETDTRRADKRIVSGDAAEEIGIDANIKDIMDMTGQTVTVIENGRKRTFRIHDAELAKALSDVQTHTALELVATNTMLKK